MCADWCCPFNFAPNACPSQMLELEHDQQQVFLQSVRAAMAHSSLVRKERSSLSNLNRGVITPLKTWFICSKLWAWQHEEQQASSNSMVLHQGTALPRLGMVLRSQLCRKAEQSIQDSSFPGLAETAKPCERIGETRDIIWLKCEQKPSFIYRFMLKSSRLDRNSTR